MQKNTLLQIMSIKIFILIILLLFFIKYIFNVMYGNHFMIQKMLFSKIKYYVKHFFFIEEPRGLQWRGAFWSPDYSDV